MPTRAIINGANGDVMSKNGSLVDTISRWWSSHQATSF